MDSYDVIIIGGGIAGSSLAYNLRNRSSSLDIAVIEKLKSRAQHKSYYVRKDLVKKYQATHLIHNELNYQTKETDQGFKDKNSFGEYSMGCINYVELCNHLTSDITVLNSTVTSVEGREVRLSLGRILQADIIIDATGHKSFLRKNFGLRSPKIGVEVIMYDMVGAELEDWHTIRLGLGNITNWGVWIEPKDKTTGRAYIGTGNLKYLDGVLNKDLLRTMMDQYLEFYDNLFAHATIENTTYVTIAADPVREVVYYDKGTHYAWIGEAAGQVDPYWTIGHGKILNLSEQLSKSIHELCTGKVSSLNDYQNYWEDQLFSFYQKNWARARLFYNLDQREWKKLFQRRSELKQELRGMEQIERQTGKKSYGFFHTLKLVGLKNIIKYLNYQWIFRKRLRNRKYWDAWRGEIRSSLLGTTR